MARLRLYHQHLRFHRNTHQEHASRVCNPIQRFVAEESLFEIPSLWLPMLWYYSRDDMYATRILHQYWSWNSGYRFQIINPSARLSLRLDFNISKWDFIYYDLLCSEWFAHFIYILVLGEWSGDPFAQLAH